MFGMLSPRKTEHPTLGLQLEVWYDENKKSVEREDCMNEFTCPHCGKSVAGNHRYEVKCYQCNRYTYLIEGLSLEQEKQELYNAADQYAYAYVPKIVREYVDKYGLAQSGPNTLRWFRDHEAEALVLIKSFLDEKLTENTLHQLHEQYTYDMPFLLYVLDALHFPVHRAPLEWDAEGSDSSEF